MAPPAKKHKGPSAYMIFSEEHRPDVQAKLRAEAADGKVPITAIAKALGERWKSLSEQEQHVYREKAQQRAAEAAAAAEGQPPKTLPATVNCAMIHLVLMSL